MGIEFGNQEVNLAYAVTAYLPIRSFLGDPKDAHLRNSDNPRPRSKDRASHIHEYPAALKEAVGTKGRERGSIRKRANAQGIRLAALRTTTLTEGTSPFGLTPAGLACTIICGVTKDLGNLV